ncbi:hypothetical protein PMAYCL1PPCAC_06512, partial [Pristionchus mayeri]
VSIRMASGFESGLNLGGTTQPTGISSESFSLRSFSKPHIVIAHIIFRGSALVVYILANMFSSSFIIQFLLLITLHSMDFWTVKNITGRLLVGLRWWNFVDEEGHNHWKYESAKDPSRFAALDRRVFWAALVLAPLFWAFLAVVAFMTLKWEWMMVTFIGLAMTGANLYGYLRCRWADTTQFTNYMSKWAFLSLLRSQRPATDQQPMQQTV